MTTFRISFSKDSAKERFEIIPSITLYIIDSMIIFTWLIFEMTISKESKKK